VDEGLLQALEHGVVRPCLPVLCGPSSRRQVTRSGPCSRQGFSRASRRSAVFSLPSPARRLRRNEPLAVRSSATCAQGTSPVCHLRSRRCTPVVRLSRGRRGRICRDARAWMMPNFAAQTTSIRMTEVLRFWIDGRCFLRLLEEADANELYAVVDDNREYLACWMPRAANTNLEATGVHSRQPQKAGRQPGLPGRDRRRRADRRHHGFPLPARISTRFSRQVENAWSVRLERAPPA